MFGYLAGSWYPEPVPLSFLSENLSCRSARQPSRQHGSLPPPGRKRSSCRGYEVICRRITCSVSFILFYSCTLLYAFQGRRFAYGPQGLVTTKVWEGQNCPHQYFVNLNCLLEKQFLHNIFANSFVLLSILCSLPRRGKNTFPSFPMRPRAYETRCCNFIG